MISKSRRAGVAAVKPDRTPYIRRNDKKNAPSSRRAGSFPGVACAHPHRPLGGLKEACPRLPKPLPLAVTPIRSGRRATTSAADPGAGGEHHSRSYHEQCSCQMISEAFYLYSEGLPRRPLTVFLTRDVKIALLLCSRPKRFKKAAVKQGHEKPRFCPFPECPPVFGNRKSGGQKR